MEYPIFREIASEIADRPNDDPAVILAEYLTPLLDRLNAINHWIGTKPVYDFANEPEWYEAFISELARFDVDLSPIWREAQQVADPYEAFEQWCIGNGFTDIIEADPPETVDLDRLALAIEAYPAEGVR